MRSMLSATHAAEQRFCGGIIVSLTMSVPSLPDIPRAFAEWSTDRVIEWLTTLQLSNDYSKPFRDHNIDGPALLRLNPSSLSSLGITDSMDRVKILQQITTMQADLASLTAPIRRWRGVGKLRRFSENTPPHYRTLTPPSRRTSAEESKPRQRSGTSQTLPRPVITDAVYPAFPETSSVTSTTYSITDTGSSVVGTSHSDIGASRNESGLVVHPLTRMAYSDVGPDHGEGRHQGGRTLLRRRSSSLKDKKKRLSRSADKLWEAQLTASPLPLVKDPQTKSTRGMSRYHSASAQLHDSLANQQSVAVRLHDGPSHRATASVHLYDGAFYHNSGTMRLHENARLVEILRQENTTLKRELEVYYQRVCKLMRLEQELDRLREAHRLLEESNMRRERLEATMRAKMEKEIARLRRHSEQTPDHRKETPTMVNDRPDRGLERRESTTKKKNRSEKSLDIDSSEVYSDRIDRLKEHLRCLQEISSRREGLERQLRTQLQEEIQQLRSEEVEREERGKEDLVNKEGEETHIEGKNWAMEVTVLQANLTKWEQKCMELTAEKELAVEAALLHKESHITQLKQELTTKEEEMAELMQKSESCNCKLAEAHRSIAKLETSLSYLQSSLHRDAALQQESPPHQLHSSPRQRVHLSSSYEPQKSPHHSSPLHQSPLHPSPHHKLHTSPPHRIPTSPPDQSQPSPAHHTHTPPHHKIHTSPGHSSPSPNHHVYPTHQYHSSPTHTSPSHHRPHPPPSHTSKTSGSMELSLGSSPSPSSSLIGEPHPHFDALLREHTPYLSNGGGDPVSINKSLHPTVEGPPTAAPRLHTNEEAAPTINSSLTTRDSSLARAKAVSPNQGIRRSTLDASPKHSAREYTPKKPPLSPTTFNTHQSADCQPRNSNSSPRHIVRRVKSKTPPPTSEVFLLPKNYKYSSLDRGPPTSHTPSDLELFNTLLGDAAPDEMGILGRDRGVKPNDRHSPKGVIPLFTYPHGNQV